MMDGFSATLEARDPSLGRMGSYRLGASTDLLAAWLVDGVTAASALWPAHSLCAA